MVVALLALILFALLFPGVLRFLILPALALVGVLFVTEAGRAAEPTSSLGPNIPVYDIDRLCASKMPDRSSTNRCVSEQQQDYDEITKYGMSFKDYEYRWDDVPADIRQMCADRDIRMFGAYPYTGLKACIVGQMNGYLIRNPPTIPRSHFQP